MKRFILGLWLAITFCLLANGSTRRITERDEEGNVKRIIELQDTVIDGNTQIDTLSITTYEQPGQYDPNHASERWDGRHERNDYDFYVQGLERMIPIVAIIAVFGLPAIIIFFIFYFRYKTRKAKYRLAEQALASGKPLPEQLFQEPVRTNDLRSKGINSIFVGIGLFIMLWALTGEFGLGCIGLLIMFMGFGQVVIHYTQEPTGKGKQSDNATAGKQEVMLYIQKEPEEETK